MSTCFPNNHHYCGCIPNIQMCCNLSIYCKPHVIYYDMTLYNCNSTPSKYIKGIINNQYYEIIEEHKPLVNLLSKFSKFKNYGFCTVNIGTIGGCGGYPTYNLKMENQKSYYVTKKHNKIILTHNFPMNKNKKEEIEIPYFEI